MRLGVVWVVMVAACHSDAVPAGDAPPTVTVDVVVVGAGTSGTAAAVAAARHGASVLVVEPSNWVGGQMASVPHLEDAVYDTVDTGGFKMTVLTGFVAEVRTVLAAHYMAINNSVEVRGNGRTAAEPRVVRDTLVAAMITAGVMLRIETDVVSVQRDGDTVTGVTLSDGTIVVSKIVIDATETGDVLPLAGAEYRVGNQDSTSGIDPNACIQSITYEAPIYKYAGGVPPNLIDNTASPNYVTEHDLFVQRVKAVPGGTFQPAPNPMSWAQHAQYRAVPDSVGGPYTTDPNSITRSGALWANDYPIASKLSVGYLEDRTTRHDIDCAAKLVTLDFMYYGQHDFAIEQGNLWSIADEGFDNSADDCSNIPAELEPLVHLFPPRAYIRESRRIVALHTLTGAEIERDDPAGTGTHFNALPFHSSIARGYYAMDLHGCTAAADLEEPVVPAQAYGPFEIPIESLIPVTIDGLLAAEKNIGTSRLANGSTRLEGVTMLVGQAAGTLAALAVMHGAQPRTIDPFEVQRALVGDHDGISMDSLADTATDPQWAAIQLAMTRGLMRETGVDSFGPVLPLTRTEAAYALATVLPLPTPVVPSDFTDVLPSNPDLKYIEAIFHAGLTAGCGGGNFCPTAAVTRAQLAVFLAKALGGSLPACTTAPYPDVSTSDPTCFAIDYVKTTGLMTGCATGFCPTLAVSRAETAAALVAVMISHGAPP